jgi:hypothetical protein
LNGDKLYQKQVQKLKLLKGVTSVDRLPSKKDSGFLSIEKCNGTIWMVFRNFMGATLFSGKVT